MTSNTYGLSHYIYAMIALCCNRLKLYSEPKYWSGVRQPVLGISIKSEIQLHFVLFALMTQRPILNISERIFLSKLRKLYSITIWGENSSNDWGHEVPKEFTVVKSLITSADNSGILWLSSRKYFYIFERITSSMFYGPNLTITKTSRSVASVRTISLTQTGFPTNLVLGYILDELVPSGTKGLHVIDMKRRKYLVLSKLLGFWLTTKLPPIFSPYFQTRKNVLVRTYMKNHLTLEPSKVQIGIRNLYRLTSVLHIAWMPHLHDDSSKQAPWIRQQLENRIRVYSV